MTDVLHAAATEAELLEWIETANDGEGPEPLHSYHGDALAVIATAVDARDRAETVIREAVARARSEGASWAMVGAALGTSRQAALKRYGNPKTAL